LESIEVLGIVGLKLSGRNVVDGERISPAAVSTSFGGEPDG
jgi:hypothetical protein